VDHDAPAGDGGDGGVSEIGKGTREMNDRIYVQHRLGGTIYETTGFDNHPHAWRVEGTGKWFFYLPKSEYIVVDTPSEQWVPIDVHYLHLDFIFDEHGNQLNGPYRVKLDTVERKVST
jgi:hypothetical protein